jgi:hypothetical protein
MGWLFAVALGMQERSTVAVAKAVVPITLGHVVSVAAVVAIAALAALALPRALVHAIAAAILLVFGGYRLVRSRHPRWVGMRVGFWGLALWGFLMASAHGAGLMLVPFVTSSPAFAHPSMPMPVPSVHAQAGLLAGVVMVGIHTLGYVLTMTAIALLVYVRFGVGFLRSAWFNVDLVWAVALIVAGLAALVT